MSKCITAAMLGFLLGMKCKECGKNFCMRRLKKHMMRKVGL